MKEAAAAFSFITAFITVYHLRSLRDTAADKSARYRNYVLKMIKNGFSLIKEKEIIRLQAAVSLFVLSGSIAFGKIIILPLAVPVILIIPRFYADIKKKKYIRAYYENLTGFLESLISGLKAGMSFVSSLRAFAEADSSPAGKEMETVLKKTELGKTIQEALYELTERIPLKENEIIVSAVCTSIETGGNLTEVLENILETIRKREELNREIKTLTSQGVLSGIITGLLPFMLAGIIFLMDPGFIMPLFTTKAGIIMMCAAVVMEITGMMVIRKIMDIR